MNTAQQYLMYALGCHNSVQQQEIAAYTVNETLSTTKGRKQFFDELSDELFNFDEIRRVLMDCKQQQKQNFKNFVQSLNNYFDWLPSARADLQSHYMNKGDAIYYYYMNKGDAIYYFSSSDASLKFDYMEAVRKQAEQLIVGDIEDFKAMTNGYFFMFGFDLPIKPVLHKMPERNSCFRFATADETFCNTIEYGWSYGSEHFDFEHPFTLKDGLLFQILKWYSSDNSFATYQFDKPSDKLQKFYYDWKNYHNTDAFPFFRTSDNYYVRLTRIIDFVLFFREMFIDYYTFLYQQWEKNSFFNNFSLVIEQRKKVGKSKKSFACSFFLGENDQLMQRPALSTEQKNLLESFGKNANLYDETYFRTEKENKQIEEILQMKPIPATDELKKQLAATLIKFSKYT